jgi:type I restriction enzyme R subunit
MESGLAEKESLIFSALSDVKEGADAIIEDNSQVMENDGFFNTSITRLVIDKFKNEHEIDLNAQNAKAINHLIVNADLDHNF